MDAFVQDTDEGGVDEIHIVYNRFVSMLTQTPEMLRLLPLEVVEGVEEPDSNEVLPLYEFEPDSSEVLDALLPSTSSRGSTPRCWRARRASTPRPSAR